MRKLIFTDSFKTGQCQEQQQISLGAFPGFGVFVPFVDGMFAAAFAAPAHSNCWNSKADGNVCIGACGAYVEGFHTNHLVSNVGCLYDLALFFLGSGRAFAFLFKGNSNAIRVINSKSLACILFLLGFLYRLMELSGKFR